MAAMASITKEIVVQAPADGVWAAVRDFGAVDRLAPGFVTDCRLEDGGRSRVVTFGSGAVAREVLVTVDDDARRLVYSIVESPLAATHDNSAVQVLPEGDDRTRFVWVKDVLPDDIAGRIDELMEQGMVVIKRALEARHRERV